jgi:hypothetical protein
MLFGRETKLYLKAKNFERYFEKIMKFSRKNKNNDQEMTEYRWFKSSKAEILKFHALLIDSLYTEIRTFFKILN